MKTTSQTFIAVVFTALSLSSCKEDHTEVIAELNTTQQELQMQDSTLKENFKQLNAFFLPDTVDGNLAINPMDSTQKTLIDSESGLLSSLDSLIAQGKVIQTSLTENTIKNKEAEEQIKEIKAQAATIVLTDGINMAEFKKLEEGLNKAIPDTTKKK